MYGNLLFLCKAMKIFVGGVCLVSVIGFLYQAILFFLNEEFSNMFLVFLVSGHFYTIMFGVFVVISLPEMIVNYHENSTS